MGPMNGVRDLVIIGSGPAALTAAIYASRAGLAPLVVASSVAIGGDLMTTTEVENFPGFPDGIQGPELMDRLIAQAEKFGAELVYDDAQELELAGEVKRVHLDGRTVSARALIYATGSEYRKLGLIDEARLTGYGVSWCATCDGAFFRDRHVAVVGGGDSAMEEATFLSRYAESVTIFARGQQLRASRSMRERVFDNPKISIEYQTAITALHGDPLLDAIEVRRGIETTMLPIDGLFIAVGSDPRTHLVHGQLSLTEHGTIAVDGRSSRTNLSGVFAAGDVIDHHYRQAATAAASGVVAALDAQDYLAG